MNFLYRADRPIATLPRGYVPIGDIHQQSCFTGTISQSRVSKTTDSQMRGASVLTVREHRFRIFLPILESGIAVLSEASACGTICQPEPSVVWRADHVGCHGTVPCVAVALQVCCSIESASPFLCLVLTVPVGAIRPTLPEAVQIAPTLLSVWFLWRLVGSRFDRSWSTADRVPWIVLGYFYACLSRGCICSSGLPRLCALRPSRVGACGCRCISLYIRIPTVQSDRCRVTPDALLIEHNPAAPHSGPDLYRVPLTGGPEELKAVRSRRWIGTLP